MKAQELIDSWEKDDFDWKQYSEQLKRENSELHFKLNEVNKKLLKITKQCNKNASMNDFEIGTETIMAIINDKP